jgi:hypothetical protein
VDDSPTFTRVNSYRTSRAAVLERFVRQRRITMQLHEPQPPSKGVTNARTQSSTLYYSIARAPGPIANGECADFYHPGSAPRLFLRLLRLLTLHMRTYGVIMARVISTMASSWGWAHGLAGAITTAGEAIASTIAVVGDIPVDFMASPPIVGVWATHPQHASAMGAVLTP